MSDLADKWQREDITEVETKLIFSFITDSFLFYKSLNRHFTSVSSIEVN